MLWDAFQWNVYVLSDTTFLVALTLAAWTLTRYLVSEDIGRLPVAAAFAMVAVSRPVGVPVLLGWLAWELLPSDRLHRRLTKHPIVAAGIGLLLVLVVGAVSGRSGWAENQMMDAWNAGLLVHDDPTFTLPIAWETADTPLEFVLANPVAFPVMVLLKAGILFLPVVPRFSTIHNAVNVVTLAPAIVLGLTGLAYLTRHRRSLARAWGTPLIVLVGIVGVTFVDWDWRYRAPLAPLLAFGTAYAVGLVPTLRRGIRRILQRLARPFLRG